MLPPPPPSESTAWGGTGCRVMGARWQRAQSWGGCGGKDLRAGGTGDMGQPLLCTPRDRRPRPAASQCPPAPLPFSLSVPPCAPHNTPWCLSLLPSSSQCLPVSHSPKRPVQPPGTPVPSTPVLLIPPCVPAPRSDPQPPPPLAPPPVLPHAALQLQPPPLSRCPRNPWVPPHSMHFILCAPQFFPEHPSIPQQPHPAPPQPPSTAH